ncbi:MAG: hypothetical protein ACR2JB_25055 [Bryobacteraceae bacterium]
MTRFNGKLDSPQSVPRGTRDLWLNLAGANCNRTVNIGTEILHSRKTQIFKGTHNDPAIILKAN